MISDVREVRLLGIFKGVEIIVGEDSYRLWTSAQNIANAGYSFDIGEKILLYFLNKKGSLPAKDLLAEFWLLEKEVEKMLEGLEK